MFRLNARHQNLNRKIIASPCGSPAGAKGSPNKLPQIIIPAAENRLTGQRNGNTVETAAQKVLQDSLYKMLKISINLSNEFGRHSFAVAKKPNIIFPPHNTF